MKCFLACFSASKHKKRLCLANAAPSKDELRDGNGDTEALLLDVTTEQQVIEEPIKPITESKEKKLEEQLSCECNEKRKVTFDFTAEREREKEEQPSYSKEINIDSDFISSNEASNPSKDRYQNCSNEESEDLDLQDRVNLDLQDRVSDSKILVQEESSESLFSLSIDSRKQSYGGKVGEKVCSTMPKCCSSPQELKAMESKLNCNQSVDSVLLKAVKARSTSSLYYQDKENINIQQVTGAKEPCFVLLCNKGRANLDQKKVLEQEIAVDASLSSWLVESETTPLSKGSANSVGNSAYERGSSRRSYEDRPILRELTVKRVTGSPFARRRRSLSSDDTPILGTIGSYWRHTGWIVDSHSSSSSKGNGARKCVEDDRANCSSTSFEARLDRASDKILSQF